LEFSPSRQNNTKKQISQEKPNRKTSWEIYPFPKMHSRGNESIPKPAGMSLFTRDRDRDPANLYSDPSHGETQTFRGTVSSWQLIRPAAVSLLNRVSSITAKHHNKTNFLRKT
jgi:hypothetical protein